MSLDIGKIIFKPGVGKLVVVDFRVYYSEPQVKCVKKKDYEGRFKEYDDSVIIELKGGDLNDVTVLGHA